MSAMEIMKYTNVRLFNSWQIENSKYLENIGTFCPRIASTNYHLMCKCFAVLAWYSIIAIVTYKGVKKDYYCTNLV